MTPRRSRLAPSPTGSLHLGNASTFLINWAVARSLGWELLMRIEDLDGPRIKQHSISDTIDILQWLGIDWDEDIVLQSDNHHIHNSALQTLIAEDRVYHCKLSRKEVEQVSSAPHLGETSFEHGIRPGNIHLHNQRADQWHTNWRFVPKNRTRVVHDSLCGDVLVETTEDIVVWSRRDKPSYQLAVVVDDHHQGITDVIRGRDLLPSAAWQEQLYESMDWSFPCWWHVPLVVGTDGRRLAKRHGDSRVATYRSNGVPAEYIVGLIARWCGILDERAPMHADTFCGVLDPFHLPAKDMVFTQEDHQWLLDSSLSSR